MNDIQITRKHHLAEDELKNEIDKLAEKLRHELSVACHWEDNRLLFHRQGAKGEITLGDNEIRVQIKLGLMLKPLRHKVENTITQYLDSYLS